MSTSYQQLLQEAYDQKRAGKKKQLQAAYDRELAEITGLEQAADRQARESATRRSTQARQDKAAWNEIQTAQGLTSGAQGQALLTMDNQLRGDLTAISQAGNAEAAELAARRQALARDLAAQLEQVQAESDYEEAMALYQLSREQDSQQAQPRRPWPPSWPRPGTSASTAPSTASPRSKSAAWRSTTGPSRPNSPASRGPSLLPPPPGGKNRAWGIFLHSPLTFWEKGV